MTFVITSIGTGFLIFYILMKSSKRNKDLIVYFFESPLLYGVLMAIPGLIALTIVLINRNRKFIIGFEFDDNLRVLKLLVRKLKKTKIQTVELNYDSISVKEFMEKKYIVNQQYKGVSISSELQSEKYDFVSNNFIWEMQPREKIYFLEEIEKYKTSK